MTPVPAPAVLVFRAEHEAVDSVVSGLSGRGAFVECMPADEAGSAVVAAAPDLVVVFADETSERVIADIGAHAPDSPLAIVGGRAELQQYARRHVKSGVVRVPNLDWIPPMVDRIFDLGCEACEQGFLTAGLPSLPPQPKPEESPTAASEPPPPSLAPMARTAPPSQRRAPPLGSWFIMGAAVVLLIGAGLLPALFYAVGRSRPGSPVPAVRPPVHASASATVGLAHAPASAAVAPVATAR